MTSVTVNFPRKQKKMNFFFARYFSAVQNEREDRFLHTHHKEQQLTMYDGRERERRIHYQLSLGARKEKKRKEKKRKLERERRKTMRNNTSSASSSAKTPCCIKVGLKRGPWTPKEDEVLANYIKKEGEGRWRTLPKRAGLLRCGKSCRLRWMNYLRPSVKRGQIAPDEEDLILRLHRLLGNRW